VPSPSHNRCTTFAQLRVLASELNSMAILAQVLGRRRLLSGFRAHHVYGNSAGSLGRLQHEGVGQQEV
jgi:hypothetical protein